MMLLHAHLFSCSKAKVELLIDTGNWRNFSILKIVLTIINLLISSHIRPIHTIPSIVVEGGDVVPTRSNTCDNESDSLNLDRLL